MIWEAPLPAPLPIFKALDVPVIPSQPFAASPAPGCPGPSRREGVIGVGENELSLRLIHLNGAALRPGTACTRP